MRTHVFSLFLACAGGLICSCADPWDSRFEGNIEPAEKSVWEIIQSEPSYQAFEDLLTETGVDTLLKRDAVFTVLIPSVESLEQLSDSSLEVKKQTLRYQISNGVLYSNEMPGGKNLLTVTGKSLLFEKIGDKYLVNKDAEITATDIPASNGVIHETDKAQYLKPNILEIINANPEYSYIAEFLAENTTRVFDEENSIPIGIDENGLTVYDSVWISSNPFFSQYGNIGSENEQFAIFLAGNTLLDTSAAGGYKIGYISKLANFIVKGIVNPDNLPGYFVAADGNQLELPEGSFQLLQESSNGPVFVINDLSDYVIPKEFLWEVTSISDFDSIRNVRTTEYSGIYTQLTKLSFKEFSPGGALSILRYTIITGPLNRDYLRIVTVSGTSVTAEIKLPEIIPGKYRITLRAERRLTDGGFFDVYLNNNLIKTGVDLNGGNYVLSDFDLGAGLVTEPTGNILSLKIKGTSPIKREMRLDYLKFVPTN
jgi:hypothetical protein